MPARVFLDSNVLIYSVGDEPRRRLAEELMADGAVVSAQLIDGRLTIVNPFAADRP